ncbi:substrate-binding domain-containing protein, partial [Rhizobium ruizarguesonis]
GNVFEHQSVQAWADSLDSDVPWSNVITPRITMVVKDAKKLGELAAQRLLARIASHEGAAAPPEDFILTPRFVRGEST